MQNFSHDITAVLMWLCTKFVKIKLLRVKDLQKQWIYIEYEFMLAEILEGGILSSQ